MGGYSRRHDGSATTDCAAAIEDHYQTLVLPATRLPTRTAGARCGRWPTNSRPWSVCLDIGNLPTGDKDPFALRRHALGVIRMLVELDLPLGCVWPLWLPQALVYCQLVSSQLDSLFWRRDTVLALEAAIVN